MSGIWKETGLGFVHYNWVDDTAALIHSYIHTNTFSSHTIILALEAEAGGSRIPGQAWLSPGLRGVWAT